MDLAFILDTIRQHGDAVYGLIFGYAAASSLLMVLFAGYVASTGALDLQKLILLCWAGSFLGDVIRFCIARFFGIGWLSGFPRIQRGVQIAARLIDRHYLWFVFVHRYPQGIRNIAGFAFGVSRVPWLPFHVLNFFAAGLWAVAIVSLGYAFGQASEKVVNDAASGLGVALLVVFLGLSWLLSRKLEDAVESEDRPAPVQKSASLNKPAPRKKSASVKKRAKG